MMKSSRYQVSGIRFWIRRSCYFISIVFGIGLLVGCNQKASTKEKEEVLLAPKPVLSFAGDTLQAKTFPDSTYQILLGNMVAAKELAEQYPDSADLAIWYGRRMAYMGRYHEAIDIFTDAIKRFPNDHRLLRHRGHRYITTRQLDLAIADFEKAVEKSKDEPNAIEPDGIPNRLNKPLGNDKFNIYYHQGLAYYLNGEFEKALVTYKKCMEVSDNDDLKGATSYWMYMSYIRSGDLETAQRFLQETETDVVEMIENDVYLELLQVYKGEKTGEEVFAMPNHPTYQYGVGFYHWINNNEEMARSVWQKALEHESWDSFGYIAAEAEEMMKKAKLKEVDMSRIFELGELISSKKCDLNNDCECCGGTLRIEDGTFDISFECFPKATIYTGTVSLSDHNISLISNGKMKTLLFRKNGDLDSSFTSSYDTLTWDFAAYRCGDQLLLKHHKSDLVALDAS